MKEMETTWQLCMLKNRYSSIGLLIQVVLIHWILIDLMDDLQFNL